MFCAKNRGLSGSPNGFFADLGNFFALLRGRFRVVVFFFFSLFFNKLVIVAPQAPRASSPVSRRSVVKG